MAGSFNNYLEDELLDHVFSAAAFTAAATLYVGLSTADPTEDASGVAEPGAGAYARKSVTNNATNWPAASAGAKSNGTAITFATATASWGTITHFFINDASTAGNYYCYADLTTSKAVTTDDTVEFAVGDLDITLT